MITNARTLPSGARISSDICIVGAGPAGISIALALQRENTKILLVESGTLELDREAQALNEGDVANGDLHSPTIRYRQRRLGGSSAIWGGRCVPFDPIDFEERDWIGHSGWPFEYKELAKYYSPATALSLRAFARTV
jgi:choline dehydrogenase-like flavoprotein